MSSLPHGLSLSFIISSSLFQGGHASARHRWAHARRGSVRARLVPGAVPPLLAALQRAGGRAPHPQVQRHQSEALVAESWLAQEHRLRSAGRRDRCRQRWWNAGHGPRECPHVWRLQRPRGRDAAVAAMLLQFYAEAVVWLMELGKMVRFQDRPQWRDCQYFRYEAPLRAVSPRRHSPRRTC